MQRQIIVGVGVFLLFLGVISVPISGLTGTRNDWTAPESIYIREGYNIPHTLQVNLYYGNEYRFVISSTTGQMTAISGAGFEIRDPTNTSIYKYDYSPATWKSDYKFQALTSGFYTFKWNGYYTSGPSVPQYTPADDIYIERQEPFNYVIYYPYKGILWLGVVMLFAGTALLVFGLISKRKL